MIKKLKEIPFFKSTEMKIAEKTLQQINDLEPSVVHLTDEELQNKTDEFVRRIQEGETLEHIRPEVFAVSREATKRVLKKRPYDVQMLGGIILDLGSVAEMRTGEGKTITSIAPVYLNALEKKGVIVSTVNEYLAERDAAEMGEVFSFLKMTVGVNKPSMSPEEKKQIYQCDITYSIHSELGFDYLRDNMVTNINDKVQRGLNYILLDEVDSILIDEARTPLIISGGESSSSYMYEVANQFARTLQPGDYEIDEESKTIKLVDSGIDKANKFFTLSNLYDIKNSELVHRIQNALRANFIMKKDVEYIVKDEKIELIDAFTGRIMEGRAYSEGLQQAIQAKEFLEIESETKTLATITYQNFFRMFKKLSGMTGTAKTEEQEFIDIYNMRVNPIPTNLPNIRVDDEDSIYWGTRQKLNAILKEVKQVSKTGQPILIGTSQIEQSEQLHQLFDQNGIVHTVLNAKQNEQEANIISQAGQLNAITIATNMAGRGTDIKPSKEALAVGGLYVLGTDKSESRRIDNQLRGRSGRQGDIGYSKFFLSLDDQLILRFAGADKLKEIFPKSEEALNSKQLKRHFSNAQKKIEGFNYDSRKTVLNYDDVIRQQRELMYSQRDLILVSEDLLFVIERMVFRSVDDVLKNSMFLLKNGGFDYTKLTEYINDQWLKPFDFKFEESKLSHLHEKDLAEYIFQNLMEQYMIVRQRLIDSFGEDSILYHERSILISTIDSYWQNHINSMDKLRSNSNMVQYAQKNPYQVYTQKGSKKFERLIVEIALQSSVQLFNNPSAYRQDQMEEVMIEGYTQEFIDKIPESEREYFKTLPQDLKSKIVKNLIQLEQSIAMVESNDQSQDLQSITIDILPDQNLNNSSDEAK